MAILWTRGWIKSVSRKICIILTFKGIVPAFAETSFTVNAAYVGSIRHDFNADLLRYRLNPALEKDKKIKR